MSGFLTNVKTRWGARQESEDLPYGGIERALIGRFLGWEDSDHARGGVD